MSASKNELIEIRAFLLKEVFTKLKYDKMLDKYVVSVESYATLNLAKKVMRELEKMCEEHGIELETFQKRLNPTQTEMLFKEYNHIKHELSLNPQDNNLKSRLIEIRNNIATGYMDLVYKFIARKVPDIEKRSDKEDIYQIGYELLLEFIDLYDVEKKLAFDIYIRYYLLQHLIERVVKTNNGLHRLESYNLNKVINIKNKLNIDDREQLIEEIMNQTGLSKNNIEYLLALEKAIQKISLENLSEDIINELMVVTPDLETLMIEKTVKENIPKLLKVLTPIQREIVMLYYGFVDGKTHSHQEIANKLGNISHERVRQIKENALEVLKMPIYQAHISESEYNTDEIVAFLSSDKKPSENKRVEELELFLLQNLPKEVLEELLSKLSPEARKVILLYLGLPDEKKHNQQEIARILDKSPNRIQKIKIESLNKIRKILSRKYNISDERGIYLNALMQKYFTKRK